MTGWLAALRIARREARRAKGRSALVIALIGLPVLAVAFAAASYDMSTLTATERLARQLGAADAELRWVHDGPVVQREITGDWYEIEGDDEEFRDEQPEPTAADVEAVLPAGATARARWQGRIGLPTATGIGELAWHALDLSDPITHGIARVTQGRAPGAGDEVAVTATAADRLGVGLGDRLEVPGQDPPTVVGVVEFPGLPGGDSFPDRTPQLRNQVVLFHPDGMPAQRWPPRWLVATAAPVDWDQVRELNRHGIIVHSRAVVLDPPAEVDDWNAANAAAVQPPQLGTGLLIAGLVALEIVLLAGPAFAVGARRRQRDLALVAAGGGTPAHLRRIVLADGVVLGGLATAAGIGLGVGFAFAARPLVEILVGARFDGYRVFPLALAGIAAFAVGTAVLAALVPAVTAARQPVVDALAGRRGITRSRRRWLVLGLVMVGLGTGAAGGGAWLVSEQVVLAGLIVGQLGLALCTPTLVGLVARLGPRLRLAPRIALRDTARNRAAAAPAIAAVMAAVAGAVTAGVVLTSLDSRYGTFAFDYAAGTAVVDWGAWNDPEETAATPEAIERVARATLPVAEVYREWSGQYDGGTIDAPHLLVPEADVCPYWERAWELSRDEQRAAARDPRCTGDDYQPYHWVAIDDGTALPALFEADPDELAAAARALRAGGAVVTDERFLTNAGEVLVGALDDDGNPRYETAVTVPGFLLATELPARPVVSVEAARRLGWEPEPGSMLFTTERMPTQEEQDAFAAGMAELGSFGWVVEAPGRDRADPMLVLLAVAAGLVALGAAAIATGLAAADRRGDLSTLGAVGASPRVRRLLSLNQSGVVAGLGTALGLLAGLGASVAVLVGLNQQEREIWPASAQIPIVVPWAQLVGLLAVPLLAMLGAALLTRSRLPIERRLT